MLPGTARAQVIRDDLYQTNGPVYAAVALGGTIYIGGNFTQVGPASGGDWVARNNIAALDLATGAVTDWNPDANGTVYALAADGVVYAGGQFSLIGGQARRFLAALDPATGNATIWNPNPDGGVSALAPAGHGLLVGGDFASIGLPSEPHAYFAALDPTTGAVIRSPEADGPVLAIAVDGGIAYVGGDFTMFGAKARSRIAAFDANGEATGWNPSANGTVRALALSGEAVYTGGDFTTIGGEERDFIAALEAATGHATNWDTDAVNGPVRALVVGAGTVIAGGDFTLAAIDTATGDASWEPSLTGGVTALVVNQPWLYVGGPFTGIGGTARAYFAGVGKSPVSSQVTISDAQVVEGQGGATMAGFNVEVWPPPSEEVKVDFATDDGTATVADGDYQGASGTLAFQPGDTSRVLLVTVNADATPEDNETFFVKLSNPQGNLVLGDDRAVAMIVDDDTQARCDLLYATNGTVHAVVAVGSTVYVGGSFTQVGPASEQHTGIGWQARDNVAAFDAATGIATEWKPDANGVVRTLLANGATVYAGGEFTSIGGAARNRIAALDAVTGLATAWNPNANGAVRALAVSGSTVYAGGRFSAIGGQARNHLAALGVTTGLATGWNPNVASRAQPSEPPIQALAVSGGTVYAGGSFFGIGGQFRSSLASLDATTGTPTAWNPGLSSLWTVRALVVSGGMVYAGGGYPTISGPAGGAFAVDATTSAHAWSAVTNSTVRALALSGPTVCAGGDFTTMGGEPHPYIALLNGATGLATAWDPMVNGTVFALAVSGNTVYAGGAFGDMEGLPHSGIACTALQSFALTTLVSPSGSGTVDRNPNLPSYPPGSSVTLTATPATGYAFTSWSGSATGSANPLAITVDGPKSITANFVGYPVNVTAAPEGAGTVAKNPDQAMYAPGSSVTLTATPATGYAFTSWSGSATGSANPLAITVDGPKSITAGFSLLPVGCGNWGAIASAILPSARVGAPAVWDPVRHRVLMFGGYNGSQFLNDLWQFTVGNGWTPLAPEGTPPSPRNAAGLVYDPVRDRVLAVGGNSDTPPSDVWELTLAGTPTWSPLATAGTAPAGRFAFSAVYDPLRDRVVLFGGYPLTNATSALSLAGTPTWSQLFPAALLPAARYAHVAIYDPVRDRMLVQGGSNLSTVFDDTWALPLGEPPAWTQLATVGAAPARSNSAAAYDPIRDRMVVVGGSSFVSGSPDEAVWSLSLEIQPIWMPIQAGGVALGARRFHSVVYEPEADALLSFFGIDGSSVYFNDAKRLECSGGWWLQTGGAHGTVTAIPSKTCYANDEVVSLQAASGESGYEFQQWLGDAAGNLPTIDVTMDDNKTVVAAFDNTVGVEEVPLAFALEEIRPNPNRGPIEVAYALPEAARVRLGVFDLAGREVGRLADGVQPAGRHHARWNGRVAGARASAGVYFIRFETPVRTWVRRLALIR